MKMQKAVIDKEACKRAFDKFSPEEQKTITQLSKDMEQHLSINTDANNREVMPMNENNLKKLEFAKKNLKNLGVIFRELPNGQLQVDSVNFWATTEKWYDTKRQIRGQGINSFVKHLKNNDVI